MPAGGRGRADAERIPVSTVMSDDATNLRIGMSGGTAARLFGAPFLLAGAYLGYYLVLNLVAILTGRAALSEFLPGTIVLTVMTTAFLVPGWLLMFSRARVEIDRVARTVTSIRDFRVYKLQERRALSEFDRLEVDRLKVSGRQSGGTRRPTFKVALAGAAASSLLVGVFDEWEDAMAHGRRLGPLIGLPVEDRSDAERTSDE